MGLRAPRTRKREMSSASGEVIDELRRTAEAQGRCILNQQKIIENLLLTLEENVLGDPLLPGELSAASPGSNGLSTSQLVHRIGPNSTPITWDGRAKDLIPISMKGKDCKAMVFADEMIAKWNGYFNAEARVRKFLKEWREEKATMKHHLDIIENLETVLELTESGRFLNGFSEAQLELEYNKSSECAATLRKEIDDIEDDLISMNIEFIRNVRTVIKHSGLRRHDDHRWLKGLGESKCAKHDASVFDPTLSSESEDSDSELEASRPNVH